MSSQLAAMDVFKLRVVLSTHNVKKVVFDQKPTSLQDLYQQLQAKVEGMPNEFVLMYEDKDFDNSLVSLTDIDELQNCMSVTILTTGELTEPVQAAELTPSCSTTANLRCSTGWPDPFQMPDFDFMIERQLQQADASFVLTWAVKRDILQKLAHTMYAFKAYPSDAEVESVAKALVAKYPCLYEKGTSGGWAGWKNSLKFKMGNFRTSLSKIGCAEVKVNSGKRSKHSSVQLPPAAKDIKKPKRQEVNYLPDLPSDVTVESLEDKCNLLKHEVTLKPMNAVKVAVEMEATFASRREEFVSHITSIKLMLDRWPALCIQSQIIAEFGRITNRNLNDFYTALDLHISKMQNVFSSVGGKRTSSMKQMLDTLADCQSDDNDFEAGQYIAVFGNPVNPDNVSSIMEGDIVVDDVENFPTAVVLFFGLHFVLNLEYANGKKSYTFECFQKLFLEMGDKLSPKLLTFKKKLAN